MRDSDADGVTDPFDAFPYDPSESSDLDRDGAGDNADAFDFDPSETSDSDGDGVGDNADAFPEDPTRIADTDGDGVADSADNDDDGDGILDADDEFGVNEQVASTLGVPPQLINLLDGGASEVSFALNTLSGLELPKFRAGNARLIATLRNDGSAEISGGGDAIYAEAACSSSEDTEAKTSYFSCKGVTTWQWNDDARTLRVIQDIAEPALVFDLPNVTENFIGGNPNETGEPVAVRKEKIWTLSSRQLSPDGWSVVADSQENWFLADDSRTDLVTDLNAPIASVDSQIAGLREVTFIEGDDWYPEQIEGEWAVQVAWPDSNQVPNNLRGPDGSALFSFSSDGNGVASNPEERDFVTERLFTWRIDRNKLRLDMQDGSGYLTLEKHVSYDGRTMDVIVEQRQQVAQLPCNHLR